MRAFQFLSLLSFSFIQFILISHTHSSAHPLSPFSPLFFFISLIIRAPFSISSPSSLMFLTLSHSPPPLFSPFLSSFFFYMFLCFATAFSLPWILSFYLMLFLHVYLNPHPTLYFKLGTQTHYLSFPEPHQRRVLFWILSWVSVLHVFISANPICHFPFFHEL